MKILLNYFLKVKKLIFFPERFFSDIQKEEGYKESTKFLFATLFFISILFLFFLVVLPGDLKMRFISNFSQIINISALGLGNLSYLALAFIILAEIFIVGIVGVLAGSLIIHLSSRFFWRGRELPKCL